MSRTLHTILRGGLGGLLLAATTFVACGHAAPPPQPVHPLGESTAPLPSNSAAPVIDAPGVPDPSAPTPAATPPASGMIAPRELDVAEAEGYAADAGVVRPPGGGPGSSVPAPTNPPNAPRPTNPGNGSGSGGNPIPSPNPAPGAPPPTPRAPSPTNPPSTPTPAPR